MKIIIQSKARTVCLLIILVIIDYHSRYKAKLAKTFICAKRTPVDNTDNKKFVKQFHTRKMLCNTIHWGYVTNAFHTISMHAIFCHSVYRWKFFKIRENFVLLFSRKITSMHEQTYFCFLLKTFVQFSWVVNRISHIFQIFLYVWSYMELYNTKFSFVRSERKIFHCKLFHCKLQFRNLKNNFVRLSISF